MNVELVSFLNSLILIALLLGLPLIGIGITCCFKLKTSQNFKIFLYAFASGLLIIMGSVGFIGESITDLTQFFETTSNYSNVIQILIKIGIIVGGAIIAAGSVFLIRYISFRKKQIKTNCEKCNSHDHSIYIANYGDLNCKTENKKIGLILLMSHRIVDGLSLGFLTLNTTAVGMFHSWGIIIVFIIHLIPTTIIVFLTQYDIYQSKKKAYLSSFLSLLIICPFVIIGVLLAEPISKVYWLMPLLYSISGTIMVIISILELIPEFIHNKNMERKYWCYTVLSLISGIILSLLLICIHTH